MKMKEWMDMDGSYEFFLSLIFILAQDFCTLSTPRLALGLHLFLRLLWGLHLHALLLSTSVRQ